MPKQHKKRQFLYEVVPINREGKPHKRLPLYSALAYETFSLRDSDVYGDVFGPNSQALFLGYEKTRGSRPNKVAVLALAFMSEHAVTMWVADRSTKNTPHVTGFLDTVERKVFSDPAMEALTIQPIGLRDMTFLHRGYEPQTIGGLAFRMTAEVYKQRTADLPPNA